MTQAQAAFEPPENALVYRREVRIEWGDCDPAAIVFYPRYLAFFDANTAYLFEAAGLPKAEMVKAYGIIGIPLVDVAAKFFIPSKFGERITIQSHIAGFGRSSMKIAHQVFKADGRVAIQAQETRVWACRDPERAEGIRAQVIPQEVIERFGIRR
jgi:4-hydroxybenzoyl-CoA thioesterase